MTSPQKSAPDRTRRAPRADGQPSGSNTTNEHYATNGEGIRETVESVVVAFILAFLFRAFEAEAFVIPTGSMAPTLYGRHKEVECKECGTLFAFGASDEVDKDSGLLIPVQRIEAGVCPNCRFENVVKDDLPFKGDRILVNKFPYELGHPSRWDVPVFKYPEEPQVNYIKRLIGLPGEEIQINRGDIYARTTPEGRFEIQRKDDPAKQMELQLMVYDNSRHAPQLLANGFPERWRPLRADAIRSEDWEPENDGGWSWNAETRTFNIAAHQSTDETPRWVRYQHLLPTPLDWERALEGDRPAEPPLPVLITDFCSYNAAGGGGFHNRIPQDDVYWVGDLTLSCTVDVSSEEGSFLLELVEGVRRYRCRFDVATGEVTLLYLDDHLDRKSPEQVVVGQTTCELQGTGKYELTFANVDQRLTLWINGSVVEFEGGGDYENPAYPGPQRADLSPIGIAAKGTSLAVSGLMIYRDIYYRAEQYPEDGFGREQEYTRSTHHLRELLHDPDEWGREYEAHHQVVTFEALGDNEFFMLGDNSPRSQDSRLWPNKRGALHRHAVPRSALVGKAFLVYWPHAIPFMNDGHGYTVFNHRTVNNAPSDYPQFTVPFYPNFSRMGRIR
ncbi:MAG: signal peptidase I [Planctomycetota bacterium]|nr:signal peptidase I [Planctomycetota bacterium]MDA1214361.1 signal peptidase I [Planctomycetota bacterium]